MIIHRHGLVLRKAAIVPHTRRPYCTPVLRWAPTRIGQGGEKPYSQEYQKYYCTLFFPVDPSPSPSLSLSVYIYNYISIYLSISYPSISCISRAVTQEAGGAGLTVETAMKMVEKGVRHYTTEVRNKNRSRWVYTK